MSGFTVVSEELQAFLDAAWAFRKAEEEMAAARDMTTAASARHAIAYDALLRTEREMGTAAHVLARSNQVK